MTTQTIVDSKTQTQSQASQVWDKLTHCAQIGDYFHVPFTPVMQVVDRDTLEDGQVWLLVRPSTGSSTEQWLLKPEQSIGTQQQPEQEPQPVGFAGDSVSVELQPAGEAIAEFDTGRCHGQRDAAERLHPLYMQPLSEYAAGYLEGYNSVLNPEVFPRQTGTSCNNTDDSPFTIMQGLRMSLFVGQHCNPSPQTEVIEAVGWSIQYDSNWDWYQVWVGDSCCEEKASSYEQAEQIAQRKIAANKFWQQHRQGVLAAYAG